MCGLVGFLGGVDDGGAIGSDAVLSNMASVIAHRGPDDAGYWSDAEQRIGLGHRRLSIVDLSPAGHQPMHAPSSRYALVFNGEIYNHMALRQALTAAGRMAWRGHSDTETLLAGFDAWGIQGTLERTVGMFAVAVWDRRLR